MSHEFRTPLNAILGFSEMLRAQYFGPLGNTEYKGYADAIHDSGGHILEMVNDLLDISAIEAGKRAFVKTEIDVRRLLEGCVKDTESVFGDKNIDVFVDAPEGLPSLSADERSFTQIVLNLLSNAIKFTGPKGTVSVSAKAANGKLAISVSDTGVGISPDALSNITEPFTQAGSDPHLAREGTGFGLSIVKSLVGEHDGTLKIESEVNVGTTVTVEFPIDSA